MLCSFTQNRDQFSKGWILKLPSTTNKYGRRYSDSLEDIISSVMELSTKFGGQLPYVVLQRKLIYNVEYKVVVFNYKARFISKVMGSKAPKSISVESKENKNKLLLQFAEEATKELRNKSLTAFPTV